MTLLRKLHLWAGLGTGLFLSLIGLSGSILLFREPLERVAPRTAPSPGCRTLSVDEAVSRALAGGGARASYVQFPATGDGPLEVVAVGPGTQVTFVAVDPCSGALLGPVSEARPWLRVVARAHRNLLLGEAGRRLLVGLAWGLLFLAISGLVMARRGRKSAHGAIGLWTSLVLAGYAISALLLLLRPATTAPPVKTGALVSRDIDSYLRGAATVLPQGKLSWIQLGDPVVVRVKMPGDLQKRGSNDVEIHPATGEVMRINLVDNKGRIRAALAALHFGEAASPWAWPLYAAAGIVPLTLLISALILLVRKG